MNDRGSRGRCMETHASELLGVKPSFSFVYKLKLDYRGRRCRRRLFPEGWEKKIDHYMKIKQVTKTPTKNGEGERTPKHERSNESERRRGKGKNAGRKTGRPKAANQVGERSPQNP
ncbi:hypothetical protein TNCV_2596821 [Trichonephila clavipes]|nr:hypothetical protein TNCV_2596821 [Trichonephila clavipes]